MEHTLARRGIERSGFVGGAAAFVVAAGIAHLIASPLHWEHAPAHGLFLALAGIVEVAWGTAFWRRSSPALHRVGVVMVGALIVLWTITRLLPAPFGHGPEEVDAFGVLCKLSEAVGLGALVALAVPGTIAREKIPTDRSAAGLLGAAVLLIGLGMYSIASAAEPALPWLEAPHADEHSHAALPLHHDEPTGTTDRLGLVVGGIAAPFANGGEVVLGGDLVAKLTLEPGERSSRTVDVYLYHQTTPPEPVANATVQVTGQMRYMDHGTFRQAAQPAGGGHYLLPARFAMPGEWQLDIDVVTADTRASVRLDIDIVQ